jgi:hypothetical protein
MFVQDFDGNGTIEQITCQSIDKRHFPIHDIDELYMQMPFMKKKIPNLQRICPGPP